MNEKNILVTIPVEQRHKKMLEGACPDGNFTYKESIKLDDLADVNVIIGNVPANLLSAAAKLEWIQLNSAGAEQYTQNGVLKKGMLLTNATGAYGLAIAEYLLAGTFSLIKRMNTYQINQMTHEWKDEGKVNSIYGTRTLIVGLGDIGSEYGQKMKALGSDVVGIKRHIDDKPEWLDELYTLDALENELAKADIVAMALPNTPATYHLMDLHKLSLMKKNAILLNVGRGNAIVSDDLCKALNDGLIFGAFVDVTDPEPLPPEHPLWNAKNIMITPHIAGQFHLQDTFEKIVRIACENLKLYRGGKALKNMVDYSTGYKTHV
jgi:phosphoglycerate dehydrogenase-like enzyme